MATITISEKEYRSLKLQAEAYQKISGQLFASVVHSPIEEVMSDFRKTELYTDEFLQDLEDGLRKSSYAESNR